jgi:hypothetical protein
MKTEHGRYAVSLIAACMVAVLAGSTGHHLTGAEGVGLIVGVVAYTFWPRRS